MQKIIRQTSNVHKVLDDIDRCYSLLSDRDWCGGLIRPTLDKSFKPLLDTFKQYGDFYTDVSFIDEINLTDVVYEPMAVCYNEKKMVLCFSGGKDSVAAAKLYKEQGYEVHLYHLKHINPSFSDEWECAKECARLLDMPIFIDDIRFSGHHIWMEHPMKNMVIANGALSYAIREGLGTNIAFGNYTTSVLESNAFDRCAGDCVDMWDRYTNIIQRIIPNFKIYNTLENMGQTCDIVCKDRALLDASLSCLCRHSLRQYRSDWVKKKFGLELPKHRCGSCYKCAIEYIYMADHDLIEFNDAYYRYCLNQLYKVSNAEYLGLYFISELWNTYLTYPMSESKLYSELQTARLFNGSIKWQGKKITESTTSVCN